MSPTSDVPVPGAPGRLFEKEEQCNPVSHLFVHFVKNLPPELGKLKLDGFAPGAPPVLGEVFAHVGRAKGGQRHKIAHDMTKLMLAEKRLGVPCRKVIAVIDEAAIAHMDKGWDGTARSPTPSASSERSCRASKIATRRCARCSCVRGDDRRRRH